MGGLMFLVIIPLTIFIIFILPIWLWLHYRHASSMVELNQQGLQQLDELKRVAKKMDERIKMLETMLDIERSHKRDSHGK